MNSVMTRDAQGDAIADTESQSGEWPPGLDMMDVQFACLAAALLTRPPVPLQNGGAECDILRRAPTRLSHCRMSALPAWVRRAYQVRVARRDTSGLANAHRDGRSVISGERTPRELLGNARAGLLGDLTPRAFGIALRRIGQLLASGRAFGGISLWRIAVQLATKDAAELTPRSESSRKFVTTL